MSKNRFLTALMLAFVVTATACGDDAEQVDPAVEAAPAPERLSTDEIVVDSAVTRGAIMMDTSMVGATADTTP